MLMLVYVSIWLVSIAFAFVAVGFSRVRKPFAFLSILSLVSALLLYSLHRLNIFTWIIGLLSAYQILNMARLYKAQMHERYLVDVVTRSTVTLCVLIIYTKILDYFVTYVALRAQTWLFVVGSVQVGTALLLLYTLVNTLVKSRPKEYTDYIPDKSLPTVSVLIPARNEDVELERCLRTVIANDYPKLEIIVLDDCSQDRRVADIVKDFAQAGVRFIPGDMPKVNWLAKNQAYETLSQAASGEWLLFIGVDVRLSSGSIRALVNQAIHTHKKMISVLPERSNGTYLAGFLTPMRYIWQLSLPRRLFGYPPVLSTAWLIERKEFFRRGGMPAVARTIIPEGFFSRELYKNHTYGFIRSNDALQVESSKVLSEQYQTAIRTLYPSVRRQPEAVALSSIGMLVVGVMPFVLVGIAFFKELPALPVLGVACALLTLINTIVVTVTNPRGSFLALINLPYSLCQEIYLMNLSMSRYEFGQVDWKGRNICAPVMHIVPHLPKTSKTKNSAEYDGRL